METGLVRISPLPSSDIYLIGIFLSSHGRLKVILLHDPSSTLDAIFLAGFFFKQRNHLTRSYAVMILFLDLQDHFSNSLVLSLFLGALSQVFIISTSGYFSDCTKAPHVFSSRFDTSFDCCKTIFFFTGSVRSLMILFRFSRKATLSFKYSISLA